MTTKLTTLVATAVAAALLAVPAGVQAKTVTFGIRLDHEPSNSLPAHNCREDGSEDPTPICSRVATSEGRSVKGNLRAPADGTIVKFRVRAGGPGTVTFRLARLKSFAFDPVLMDWSGFGKSAGAGPTVQVAGNGFAEEGNPIETFPARMKVHKGDYLGLDSTATSALYCSGGGNSQAIFATPLNAGYQRLSDTDGCELMVQAVMRITPRPRG
jgi:hypothetical protein